MARHRFGDRQEVLAEAQHPVIVAQLYLPRSVLFVVRAVGEVAGGRRLRIDDSQVLGSEGRGSVAG